MLTYCSNSSQLKITDNCHSFQVSLTFLRTASSSISCLARLTSPSRLLSSSFSSSSCCCCMSLLGPPTWLLVFRLTGALTARMLLLLPQRTAAAAAATTASRSRHSISMASPTRQSTSSNCYQQNWRIFDFPFSLRFVSYYFVWLCFVLLLFASLRF